MEQNALFRKRYGSFRRFFAMLGKARLPYLWIVGYLAVSALIANVSVSTTEYSAALFAGQVGLFAVVLPYLFFTLLSLVIGSISSLTSNLCLARIDRNLRRMVWKKVVHLPLQFYEANNPKELLSRITTDVTSISTLIMQVLLPVFTTAYSSLLMLGRVSSYDQRLMWALVIVLPVNILISFVLGRMRFGVADLINRRNAQLTAAIAERANNMLLIKSMGTEEKEAVAGEARMKASYQAEVTDLWVRGLALPINAIAGALQSVAIILAGRAFYSAGALDLTQWIAYYGFAIQLTNILSNYCNSWSNFKGAQGSVDRVSQIMDEQEEPLDKGRDAGALAGNISLRDVCFSYGDKPLFTGFNAEIPAGQITAIVGPSGSGKTTLMKLAAGLLVPTGGSLRVCGQAPGPQTKARVAYLPERTYLPAGLRVREALELFCDFYADFSREKAVSMLADLKIQPGDKISAMSKGTREKVQLVLVMSRAAGLYLLDEPIGGVDPASRDYILDTIIRNYSEDAALVLSTHLIGDIEKVLDDVVMIGGGRLVASGSVDELRAAQGKSVDAFFREVFKC